MQNREIADAIGDICDGVEISAEAAAMVRAALCGPVATSDSGERLFYVQTDTCALANVDTAECVWSSAPGALDDDTCFRAQQVPLPWLGESGPALTRLSSRFPEWEAFWRRVAAPLLRWRT